MLTASAPATLAILLTVLGIATLSLRPLVSWRVKVYDERQAWSRMKGTPVEAVATDVTVVKIADRNRWKVTLKYDDTEGRTRWHRATIVFQKGVAPQVGERYTVRYDPDHPRRRSTISVNLTQPKRSRYARRRPPRLP